MLSFSVTGVKVTMTTVTVTEAYMDARYGGNEAAQQKLQEAVSAMR